MLAAIFDTYVDAPFEMGAGAYGPASTCVSYPIDWLSDLNLPLVKCILFKMDFSQVDQLDRSTLNEFIQ